MKKLLIVGLGLIGASIAKASKGFFEKIDAIDNNAEVLRAARADGVIDEGFLSPDTAPAQVDLICLCTPVGTIPALAARLAAKYPDALFTDAGSTKKDIAEAMEKLGVRYVGTHPMAGSELSGYTASRADLFVHAVYCIITDRAEKSDIKTVRSWIIYMGAQPIEICAYEHDIAVAAISHLPHLLASALTRTAAQTAQRIPETAQLAAGGFLDMTRIAGSDPTMWQNIFLHNTNELKQQLSMLQQRLQLWQEMLERKDAQRIYDEFAASGKERSAFAANMSGIFPKKGFELVCALPDEESEQAKTILQLRRICRNELVLSRDTARIRFSSYEQLLSVQMQIRACNIRILEEK